MKDTGGPAFPVLKHYANGHIEQVAEGMSLRDYFAAKALAIAYDHFSRDLEGNPNDHDADWYGHMRLWADEAYSLADAMLDARTK